MPKQKNTVEILERRKTMIDALITFIAKHPKAKEEAHAKGLEGGKNGLSFPDYALIVPYWNKGDIQLRLLKSGENWMDNVEDRQVSDDVTNMSDKEFNETLEEMYQKANPDDDEDDDDDE
ncbi:MAG TPA: hypothetical protein VGG46_04300 [Terriglobales bacterium]|jgi:hypothetical protein